MIKIIILGSTKLVDKIKHWVEYFENSGYHVLDYYKQKIMKN